MPHQTASQRQLPSRSAPMLAAPVALGLAMLVTFASWREGIFHLIGVWAISPTYTHGFIVAPLSAFLVFLGWRRSERFTPWPLALGMIVPAALIYAAGSLADVRLAQHLGIVTALMSLTAGFLGRAVAIRHRFALLFLVAMVPVGEGLLPALQLLTAHGIMAVTEVSGVAAIRTGTIIDTDAGRFLVEEGCAGLRFMIASAVTGVLGAHLFYRTKAKQVAFISAAILIPILANIVRASTVVLVATWTDMKHATGFDHVVYGWGLFSIIMGIILVLGMVTSEPDAPKRPSPPVASPRGVHLPVMLGVVGSIIVAGLV